jgi:glycine/D-amino acid oxidase-like deaminating enzyme
MAIPHDARSLSPWMSFQVPEFDPLPPDITHCDVCVVGAGIAGLSTAYLLMRKGRSVLVLDDGPIGHGQTARTTAHLSGWIDDHYTEIERMHGAEAARLAAASHRAAIEAIESIVEQEGIACDFARVDGYLFSPPDADPADLERELEAAKRAGVEGVEMVARAPMGRFDTGAAIRFPRLGQFHPLKYLAGLARALTAGGQRVHTGEHVAKVEGGEHCKVTLASGREIAASAVVVATNAPISDRVAIHTKQAPYMTYVIALRVPKGAVERALFWDTLDEYHYVRLADTDEGELLLVGGEDHKSGQSDDGRNRHDALEIWARERFPLAGEVTHRWSGQVMETHDGLAFAGHDPFDRNVFLATGDSGMGMTHGTIAAIVLTDLIGGVRVPWAELYDPKRKPVKALGTFAKETANMAWQYADWLRGGAAGSADEIAPGAGAVLRRGLHKLAVYRDPQGGLHEMSAMCTHLGCQVAWNTLEATWDCPCHGSRFDRHGHVINGPAASDLKRLEGDVRAAD